MIREIAHRIPTLPRLGKLEARCTVVTRLQIDQSSDDLPLFVGFKRLRSDSSFAAGIVDLATKTVSTAYPLRLYLEEILTPYSTLQ